MKTFLGDECDDDIDGDGIMNEKDNCIYVQNADQTDANGNHLGDACENDLDNDGVIDTFDVCPKNKHVQKTNFKDGTVAIDLYPGDTEPNAGWLILNDGKEVRQIVKTNATSIFIGAIIIISYFY